MYLNKGVMYNMIWDSYIEVNRIEKKEMNPFWQWPGMSLRAFVSEERKLTTLLLPVFLNHLPLPQE